MLGFHPDIRILDFPSFISTTIDGHGPFPSYYHGPFCRLYSDHIQKRIPHLFHLLKVVKRIHILRGTSLNSRDISNTTLLDGTLTEFLFESYDTGSLDYSVQAYLFNQASIIIGVHGAAFANIIFCRPDTTVIELFPKTLRLTHEKVLSYNLGVKWHRVFYDLDPSGASNL